MGRDYLHLEVLVMRVKKYLITAMAMIFGTILLMGCSIKSGSIPDTPQAQASSTPTTQSPENNLVVKLDDNGKSIDMIVGQQFLLDLGSDYQWNISINNQEVLERLVNITVIKGAQGVYQAKLTGTSTLHATGTFICRPDEICSHLALNFQIQVVVAAGNSNKS